jgi:signal transduction histidine kinase
MGLILGGLAFNRFLRASLLDNLDETLLSQAVDRASTADAGADPAALASTIRGETAIAIFDSDGTLLVSRGLADTDQIADAEPGTTFTRTVDLEEVDENEVETYSLRVAAAQPGSTRVVIASEFDSINSTLADSRRLLAFGIPLATLIGTALFWLLTGRALRPVETLRRDAQKIAESGTGGRVQQPQRTDEIGRLASTLNNMLERLDERTEILHRFVSDASHEIRSPVANIRARIETARPDDWARTRPDVVGEVERVEAIVDDLTYLARSDEGRVQISKERIELDQLLFDEAARLQSRGRVTVDASAVEPLVVNGDRGQLARVVRNLVDNAERHAEAEIGLAVHETQTEVAIQVDDDGPGIPMESRDAVFERFSRLDDSRQRLTGGTGLGLAIVRDIVSRHEGMVTIGDSPLGGARVTITLPRSTRPVDP